MLGYPIRRWLEEDGFWTDVLLHPQDRTSAVTLCTTATEEGRDHDFDYRALAAELAAERDLELVITGELPVVTTERVPLMQVFQNLLSNAWKHAGGRAEVRSAERAELWELSVRDDGPGIPPEYHDRIWGVFQMLQSRDEVEGTGIGLAEPFTAAALDRQLDDQARRFLANPRKDATLSADGKTVRVSRIFEWFEDDFDKDGGVRAFLEEHAPAEIATRIGADTEIEYLDYDWTANAKSKAK